MGEIFVSAVVNVELVVTEPDLINEANESSVSADGTSIFERTVSLFASSRSIRLSDVERDTFDMFTS
jgi:hypothetical protein